MSFNTKNVFNLLEIKSQVTYRETNPKRILSAGMRFVANFIRISRSLKDMTWYFLMI